MLQRIDHAVLIHGYAETPERTWFPWLHKELERSGMRVAVPALPDTYRPNIKRWMKAVLPLAKTLTKTSVIIGHSLGGVLALRLLEKRLAKPIAATILVGSPYASTIKVDPLIRFFEKPVDWWTVTGAAKKFIVLHAKDDPLVPFDHAIRYQESLGADLMLYKKGGHFVQKTASPVLRVINSLR